MVLAVATVAATWPWVADPGLTFPQRDTAFNLVALVHLQDVVLHGAPWRASPLGFPLADSVALTDWMAGQALLGIPLRLLGVGPVRMHDLVVVLGLFLSAWAAHRLAEAVVGRGPHTWVAGVIGGLGPVQLAHAQHVNLVHHEGVIGGALLLGAGLHGRRPGMAAAGALLLGAAGHLGAYLGMQGAVIGAVVLAALGWKADRHTLVAAVVGGLAGLGTMAPVAAVYRSFQALHEVRLTAGELGEESWDLARTFASGPPTGEPPNPGFLALALAVAGLWGLRRRAGGGVVLAATVVTAVLALGPSLRWGGVDLGIPLPGALLGATLRAPARWLAVAHVGVGVMAAGGLAGLLAKLPGRVAQAVVALVAVGVALAEVPRAEVAPASRVAPERVHARLGEGDGPVYESVGGRDGGRAGPRACGSAERKLHAAVEHGRPVVGGQYARSFPAVAAVNRLAGSWPSPVALSFFELTGVTTTLEHPPLRPLPDGLASCELVDGHRLCAIPAPDRDPLPALDAVSPGAVSPGGFPVVGFRWPGPLPIGDVALTCDGAAEISPAGVWNGLALVRQGGESPPTDVFFAHPCVGVAAASLPGGEALGPVTPR